MNVKYFIDRPVLSIVLSLFIVIAGIIGLQSLPIERYPDMAPPTISVFASYPGASAETIQKAVVSPLEQAINGVEDMIYMTSSASNNGSASITIFFQQGTNPDMAAVNVQNRVARATGLLPSEVNQIGVTTMKRQSSMLQVFSLSSPHDTYDMTFLSNYMNIKLKPAISRIKGVGDMMVLGPSYSMRLWLKPDIMAQYKLIPSDITKVLGTQNIEAATGSFGENSDQTKQYTLKFKGRKMKVEEFEDMVIRALPSGEVLRIKDVAKVELGRDSYAFNCEANGHPGVVAILFQTAGSNATAVNIDIDNFLEKAKKELPQDVEINSVMSSNDFLFASMHEVFITLLIAIVLVILVVYFFLQDIRSTIVPAIAIFVSLIGTFAFLAIIGFSLNLLTLFALVLVIGTVVDDAIIVVEAVQARFNSGYKSSYLASVDAMKGLTSAIITTSIVFMAVFIPITMIEGTSGTFYTQFGITMAIAVAISTLNALTLSPALCALILKPVAERAEGETTFADRMRKAYNASFSRVLDKYKQGVLFFVHRKWFTWGCLALAIVSLGYFMNTTKTGLVPDEDTGTIIVAVNAAPGSSLAETNKIMQQIEKITLSIPEVKRANSVAGYSMLAGAGASYGMIFLRLNDWSERTEPAQQVDALIGQIYGRTAGIKNASIFALSPPMISGYGAGNGFELQMQDLENGDIDKFYQTTQSYLAELQKRPEIQRAFSSFNPAYPQYVVDVDVVKCMRKGIAPTDVLSVLSGYFGGQYVSNINRFTKVYRVMIQADPKYRLDENSLDDIFVRVQNQMAPISQFITLKRVNGAEALSRFNMYNSISVNGTTNEGYSTGDAIKAIKEVAATHLPRGYGFDFSGLTREENNTSNNTIIIFAISFLFIYLILAALYESFFIPFAVILSVPFGLLGSFLFARMLGLENNIYLQTGLIMLIGLLSKTAILLTEYATERRHAGMTLKQAAYVAAEVRFRPILMTALTMVFGMLPLMFASGVGANGNSTLGAGVVGGMLIGTLALLFVVPTFFIVFQYIEEKFKPIEFEAIKDPMIEKAQQEIDESYRKKNVQKNNENED